MTIDFANVIPQFDYYLARGLCTGVGKEVGQVCIEAAMALALGEGLTDQVSCDAPAVRSYKIGLNDSCHWASPESRAAGLRAIGIASLGSKGVMDEDVFAARVYELTVREQIPALFRLLLADEPTCLAAADRCEQEGTREAAIAARDAARAVARARGYTGPWYYWPPAEVAAVAVAVVAAVAAVAVARVANTERVEREHRHATEDAQARIAMLRAELTQAEQVRAQYNALSQMLSPPGFGPAPLAETCAEVRRLYREEERLGKRVEKLESPRVVAAAVMAGEAVFSLPAPKRHHHILHSRAYQAFRRARNRDGGPDGLQGFLLSDGTFADRKRAWEAAVAAGQLLKRAPTDGRGGTLYSEDLW